MVAVPDPTPQASEWLTHKDAADRLGLEIDAVSTRARRGGWPKRMRNDTGEAEILVPAAELAKGAKPARKRETLSLTAPLEAALEKRELANKVLQAALDVARAEIAAGQIETAKAQALLEGAKASLAEKAKELERETQDRQTLQQQGDAVRGELHAAQLEAAEYAGKAATQAALREGAEREAQELRRQLEALQARPRRPWWRRW